MNREDLRRSLAALGRQAARQQDERLDSELWDDVRVDFQRGPARRAERATTTANTRRLRRPAALGKGALVIAALAAAVVLWCRSWR